MKFYNIEKGEILFDGKKIDEFSVDQIRNSIAYVDQNTFLFSDTIKNNLLLGNPLASDEDIKKACEAARANEFIEKLPLGYDTFLDENGANLSGGQRQRLAIARALLRSPKLLILDEATSNLDTITEQAIKNTVFNLDPDLTCIIIAHRLSTIRKCDQILVMNNGTIAEKGNHEELISKKGLYSSYVDNT